MRGNGNPATVNEEQLFVGLVHERLVAAKGEEVGIQYDAALENQMATISQDDGYVFMEKVVIASAGATPGTFFLAVPNRRGLA